MTEQKKDVNGGDGTTAERKLRKTSKALCKTCKYSIWMGQEVGCYYIVITKKRRGCPIGWCDKYSKGKTRRRFNDYSE